MRFILSKESKKELLRLLKIKYDSKSLNELSKKINIPKETLNSWFYIKDRTLPDQIIPKDLLKKIKVEKRKENNWWRSKGGRVSYLNTINKYGVEEIKRRQSLGGKRGAKTKERIEKENFFIDIKDPLFLEFYGALLGDGWISKNNGKNKWILGVCGNLSLDKEFILNIQRNIKKLFNREGYLSERPKNNVIQFVFGHRILFKFITEELNFPIGKKKNLRLDKKIINLGESSLSHVLRGIFDTDGSFFLGRNRKGVPYYPIISIHMNSPILIKQIGEILSKREFRVNYSDHGTMIRLNGKEHLLKWMNEIGSSNKKHLDKINKFILNIN
jgi:hypothetical protein